MILAGDIGGTHTRLALFDGDPHEPRIVEPVLDGAVALHQYQPGTWDPRHASRLARLGWHSPAS